MLNTFSSLSRSRRPQSQTRYPTLMNAKAGRGAQVQQDALGRALVRNDERSNAANDRFPAPHGYANPKGPESYAEDIRAAGGNVQNGQFAQSVRSPQSPGGIGGLTQQDYATYLPETQGRRPPSARLQALAATRKNGPDAFGRALGGR